MSRRQPPGAMHRFPGEGGPAAAGRIAQPGTKKTPLLYSLYVVPSPVLRARMLLPGNGVVAGPAAKRQVVQESQVQSTVREIKRENCTSWYWKGIFSSFFFANAVEAAYGRCTVLRQRMDAWY
eukprot:702400-Rhodomonas_salina.2